jgi:hypothetical protein
MATTRNPWQQQPLRVMTREYLGDFEQYLKQDLTELARESREDFHVNTEMVMGNLAQSPGGQAHLVTFDSDKFEKLALLGEVDILRGYLPHASRFGIRVLAYLNIHWFDYGFGDQHPGWEQVLADGERVGRRYPLYGSGTTMCLNSPWREWAFELIREAMRTGIAGVFLDGGTTRPSACSRP